MIINFNIGLLGHVDSGKTTLARTLSSIASTAAFDKSPQARERGITLDLGFSALKLEAPTQLKAANPTVQQLQLTFVDCPGHASLIRTIIGGTQIIDLMILVIDAQKGIQTQTAECIVLGEILQRKLMVVVNKIDLFKEENREVQLQKLHSKLRKTLGRTSFGGDVPIFNVAALSGLNIKELIEGICDQVYLPQRVLDKPLVLFVDHCFAIKGGGTVCTGTIVQGQVAINDTVEIPALLEQRKVKSIQAFHQPVQKAAMGDRIGLCITQFNTERLERGIICQPGYLQPIYAACICVQHIPHYKLPVRSKTKFHISIGIATIMATVIFFRNVTVESEDIVFDFNKEYEYVEELESKETATVFALLQFETAVFATEDATLIASKLDMDAQSNCCRLAFWGRLQWTTHTSNYAQEQLTHFKIFKRKLKQGTIQRLVNDEQVIVQNLFKKEGNRDMYVGKSVELSTGEKGHIGSTFGQTSKVKIGFRDGLKAETLKILRSGGGTSEVKVVLKFKKFIFSKNKQIIQ